MKAVHWNGARVASWFVVLVLVAAATAAAGPGSRTEAQGGPAWHFTDGSPVRWDMRIRFVEPDFAGRKTCRKAIQFEEHLPITEANCARLWLIYQEGWRAGELDSRFEVVGGSCKWATERECTSLAARHKQLCAGLLAYAAACREHGYVLVAIDRERRIEELDRQFRETLERAKRIVASPLRSARVDQDGGAPVDAGGESHD